MATAASCLLFSGLLWFIVGAALESWIVALGMDDERAALITAMLVVGAASLLTTLATGEATGARLGGIVAFAAIDLIPFLVRAARTPTTSGLTATLRPTEWVLEPLGLLILGALSATVGVAIGLWLQVDARRLAAMLRRRRWAWPLVPATGIAAILAIAAALVALQEGPLSELYNYGANTNQASFSSRPPLVAALGAPGRIEGQMVAGRSVLVYVPGASALPGLRLPVVYFLHGTPGGPQDWLDNGAQLAGVLDQLIARGEVPPLIGVMPDGNGPHGQDTEWGDSPRGDIEDWLVQQVVPTIDRTYRTLGAAYRGIAGLSSGGFGALNLAMRHPDVFRWAASYSGYFIARADIFGALARGNSPQFTAASLPLKGRMPLYLGMGVSDRAFYADTKTFAAALQRLGWVPRELDAVAGAHSWEAWRTELVDSLRWLGRLWGVQPWRTPIAVIGPARTEHV